MLNLLRFVGMNYLKMKPIRSVLTTLGVAFGIALFVAIEIINRSTLNSFKESVDAVAGKATITVSAGESGFPEEKLGAIEKTLGVKNAVPMIESRAYFAGKDQASETLTLFGVDLLKEQSVRTYKTTHGEAVDDPLVFLNQPDSLIVSHSFAEKHALRLESTLELATARGTKKFTVRGMLTPEGAAKAYGGAVAIMDIDAAQVTFGKEKKYDRIDIVNRPGENIDELIGRLTATLGEGYHVERPESHSENMQRMVKSYQMMLTFFSTLALLVGLFLVTNSISIAVAERRREIGTLRTLGATRSGILLLFLFEAFAMGAIGSFAGTWLGRILSSYLVSMVSYAMSAQYLAKIEVSRLDFRTQDWVVAMAIGSVAAVLAALWPSFRATQIQPLEAMKRNEEKMDSSALAFHRISPYLGFGMLGYLGISSYRLWGMKHPLLENLNQFCAMVGSALAGPSIVAALMWAMRPFLAPFRGTVSRLAEDNLLRNPQRTGSNVMSLMVGLILVIMIAVVNISFKETIVEWFDHTLHADLVVSSNGRMISFDTQPLHESVAQDLDSVPGVQIGPNGGAFGLRFVHIQYEGRQLGLKAFDEPDPALKYSTMVTLDRPVERAGYELHHTPYPVVMVSENFTLHFKKKTGDSIDLPTPSGLINARIVGVVVDFASSEGVVYMSRDLYKKLWKDPLVSAYDIRVKPGYDINTVRSAIDQRFGKSRNLTVMSNSELKQQMIQVIDQSFADTRAIELAALIVGLLGLLNTLLISVMERTREIGMLRAIGMSRRQMSKMIVQEALIQGGLGAIAAVLLGSWISYLFITKSMAHLLGWLVRFHFPWISIGTTVFIGIGVALVASLYPAYRASSLAITEALEYE